MICGYIDGMIMIPFILIISLLNGVKTGHGVNYEVKTLYNRVVTFGESFDSGCFFQHANTPSCNVDPHCMSQGNCCPSFVMQDWTQIQQAYSQLQSGHDSNQQSQFGPLEECRLYASDLSSNSTHSRIIISNEFKVIAKCTNRQSASKTQCESERNQQSTDESLPVIDTRSGAVFRNRYCAQCNSISSYKVIGNSIVCSSEAADEILEQTFEGGNYEMGTDCLAMLNRDLAALALQETAGSDTKISLEKCQVNPLPTLHSSNQNDTLNWLCKIYTQNKCHHHKNIYCAILHNQQQQCQSCQKSRKSNSQAIIPDYSFYINTKYLHFPKLITHKHIRSICSNTKQFENAFQSQNEKTIYCLKIQCPQKMSFDLIARKCIDPKTTMEIQIKSKNSTLNHFTILEASCKRSNWIACKDLEDYVSSLYREDYMSTYFERSNTFIQYKSEGNFEHLTLKFLNVLEGMSNDQYRNLLQILSDEISQYRHSSFMEINIIPSSGSIMEYKEKQIDTTYSYNETKLLWTEGKEKISDITQSTEVVESMDKCRFEMYGIWRSSEEDEETMSHHTSKLKSLLESKYPLYGIYMKPIDKEVGVWICPKIDYSLLKECKEYEQPVELQLSGESEWKCLEQNNHFTLTLKFTFKDFQEYSEIDIFLKHFQIALDSNDINNLKTNVLLKSKGKNENVSTTIFTNSKEIVFYSVTSRLNGNDTYKTVIYKFTKFFSSNSLRNTRFDEIMQNVKNSSDFDRIIDFFKIEKGINQTQFDSVSQNGKYEIISNVSVNNCRLKVYSFIINDGVANRETFEEFVKSVEPEFYPYSSYFMDEGFLKLSVCFELKDIWKENRKFVSTEMFLLSRNKPAYRPSDYKNEPADTVDGLKSRSSPYSENNYDDPLWFLVDLQHQAVVVEMLVYYGGKTLSNFVNFHMMVGIDGPIKNIVPRDRSCYFYPGPPKAYEIIKFPCGLTGRYVSGVRSGSRTYYKIIEVEIFGVFLDKSLHYDKDIMALMVNPELAVQSSGSTQAQAPFSLTKECRNDHFSKTNSENNPLWMIDLERPYVVSHIELKGILTSDANQFSNAHLMVSDTTPKMTERKVINSCGYYEGPASQGSFIQIDCNKRGRYLSVMLEKNGTVLAMCEMMIYVNISNNEYGNKNDKLCMTDMSPFITKCSSDSSCIQNQNCCPSYLNTGDQLIYNQIYDQSMIFYSRFSCIDVVVEDKPDISPQDTVSIEMISRCPQSDYSDFEENFIRKMCEDPGTSKSTLTLVVDANYEVYKNEYCAICNEKTGYRPIKNVKVCPKSINQLIHSFNTSQSEKLRNYRDHCYQFMGKDILKEALNTDVTNFNFKQCYKSTSILPKTVSNQIDLFQWLCFAMHYNPCGQYRNIQCARLYNASCSCDRADPIPLKSSPQRINQLILTKINGFNAQSLITTSTTLKHCNGKVVYDPVVSYCFVAECRTPNVFDPLIKECIDIHSIVEIKVSIPNDDDETQIIKDFSTQLLSQNSQYIDSLFTTELNQLVMTGNHSENHRSMHYKTSLMNIYVDYKINEGKNYEVLLKFYGVTLSPSNSQLRYLDTSFVSKLKRISNFNIEISSGSTTHALSKGGIIDEFISIQKEVHTITNSGLGKVSLSRTSVDVERLNLCSYNEYNVLSISGVSPDSVDEAVRSRFFEILMNDDLFLTIELKERQGDRSVSVWLCPKDVEFYNTYRPIYSAQKNSDNYLVLKNYTSPTGCFNMKQNTCSQDAKTCREAGDCCVEELNQNWPKYFHGSENIASCHKFISDFKQNNIPSDYVSLLIIDKCMNQSSPFKQYCEISNDMDSMVIGREGKLYKNKYCAYCNSDVNLKQLPYIRFCPSNISVSIDTFRSECHPILHPLYLSTYGDISIEVIEEELRKLRKCKTTQTYQNSTNDFKLLKNIQLEHDLIEFLCLVSEETRCSVKNERTYKNTFCAILEIGEACDMCSHGNEVEEYMNVLPDNQNVFVYNSERFDKPSNVEEITYCQGKELLKVVLPGEQSETRYCKFDCDASKCFSFGFKKCINPTNILELEVRHLNQFLSMEIAKQILSFANVSLNVFNLMEKYNLSEAIGQEYSLEIQIDKIVVTLNMASNSINSLFRVFTSELRKLDKSVIGNNPDNFNVSISNGPLTFVKSLNIENELSFSFSTSEVIVQNVYYMFGDETASSKNKDIAFNLCRGVHFYIEKWGGGLSDRNKFMEHLEKLYPEMVVTANENRYDVEVCNTLLTLLKKYGHLGTEYSHNPDKPMNSLGLPLNNTCPQQHNCLSDNRCSPINYCCSSYINTAWPDLLYLYNQNSFGDGSCYKIATSIDIHGNIVKEKNIMYVDKCHSNKIDSNCTTSGMHSSSDIYDLVIGKLNNDVYAIYRNRYCALCNNIPSSQIISIPSYYLCQPNTFANLITMETYDLLAKLHSCRPLVSLEVLRLAFDDASPELARNEFNDKTIACQSSDYLEKLSSNSITSREKLIQFICQISKKRICESQSGQILTDNLYCGSHFNGTCSSCNETMSQSVLHLNTLAFNRFALSFDKLSNKKQNLLSKCIGPIKTNYLPSRYCLLAECSEDQIYNMKTRKCMFSNNTNSNVLFKIDIDANKVSKETLDSDAPKLLSICESILSSSYVGVCIDLQESMKSLSEIDKREGDVTYYSHVKGNISMEFEVFFDESLSGSEKYQTFKEKIIDYPFLTSNFQCVSKLSIEVRNGPESFMNIPKEEKSRAVFENVNQTIFSFHAKYDENKIEKSTIVNTKQNIMGCQSKAYWYFDEAVFQSNLFNNVMKNDFKTEDNFVDVYAEQGSAIIFICTSSQVCLIPMNSGLLSVLCLVSLFSSMNG